MENKGYVPELISSSDELSEFIYKLDFEKIGIEGITIHYELTFNTDSKKEIVPIIDAIDL